MIVLGIESSCDETAAAVVENGKRVLSDVIASQIAEHTPYGGVVPEIASRMHVEAVLPVISGALREAGMSGRDLDAIAVTRGPGLIGALLVGLSAAKAMAYALDRPLIGVNHLEGHMSAAAFGGAPEDRPFVCLVVSGGHTALYRVDPGGRSSFLGSTRDDAAGEAFDKVAKLLGLGYPGGVVIDRLASGGDPHAFSFPKAFLNRDSLEFSFSGLKTAVANFLRRMGPPALPGNIVDLRLHQDSSLRREPDRSPSPQWEGQGEGVNRIGSPPSPRPSPAEGRGSRADPPLAKSTVLAPPGGEGPYRVEDLVAGFQEAVVEVLIGKTLQAAEICGVDGVAVVGGVAANRRLRQRLGEATAEKGLALYLPPMRFCTDNAVMIAAAGYTIWKRSGFCPDPLDVDAVSRWF